MSRVTVDAVTSEKLRNAMGEIEICDEAGAILGHFHLAHFCPEPKDWQSPFTIEEIQERRKEKGGRALAEILKDLNDDSSGVI